LYLLCRDHVLFRDVSHYQVCLTEAFRRGDLGDFVYALEFLNADLNQQDESGLTIFQKILKTPNSADYIKNCINNDADCYSVSKSSLKAH
jgi:hypothetical protein